MKNSIWLVLMVFCYTVVAMDNNKDVREDTQTHAECLHKAIDDAVSGDATDLERLLKSGINPNLLDEGETPLKKINETLKWYEENKIPQPPLAQQVKELLEQRGGYKEIIK